MMLVLRNRYNELERLFNGFDSLFAPRYSSCSYDNDPAVNVYENDDAVSVVAELPGLSKDDVSITAENGRLTVSGEWQGSEESAIRRERRSGSFETTIRIPSKIENDAISATMKDGLLTVTLPKTAEVKPKQITVKAA